MKKAAVILILLLWAHSVLMTGDTCSHQLRLVVRRSTRVSVNQVQPEETADRVMPGFVTAGTEQDEFRVQWRSMSTGRKISLETGFEGTDSGPFPGAGIRGRAGDDLVPLTGTARGECRFRLPGFVTVSMHEKPLSRAVIRLTVTDAD